MSGRGGPEAGFDDAALRSKLLPVFNACGVMRRIAAIAAFRAGNAVLREPEALVAGRAAVSEAVNKLLLRLPTDFAFTAIGSAVGHHGLARLAWRGGPAEGPALVTRMDFARFGGGRIRSLHLPPDPAAS